MLHLGNGRLKDVAHNDSHCDDLLSTTHDEASTTDVAAVYVGCNNDMDMGIYRPPSGISRLTTSQVTINAARTASSKKKYGPQRQGAKAVKRLERVSGSGDLTPVEATAYRAFSARANYLAQDRPNLAFSTKELCREFAIPNMDSFLKLKRVVR